MLYNETFLSLSNACKNFQIFFIFLYRFTRKKEVFRSGYLKNRAFLNQNLDLVTMVITAIVFSLMISQSKVCFYSTDRSNLLFCFSLPFTFLLTELIFFRKVLYKIFLG